MIMITDFLNPFILGPAIMFPIIYLEGLLSSEITNFPAENLREKKQMIDR